MEKYKMKNEDIISLRRTINNVKKLKIFKELEDLKNKDNDKNDKYKIA